MSKEQLQRHVLDNPDIEIYECGRQDIRAGIVDRRVLATLEYLAASGMKPTVTSLRCGHGYYTASGNVSEHSCGVGRRHRRDQRRADRRPPGRGLDHRQRVRALLALQGTMKAHQIITSCSTRARTTRSRWPTTGTTSTSGTSPSETGAISVLRPDQWDRLIGSLARVPNPVVSLEPSEWSIEAEKQAIASTDGDAGR